MQKGHLFVTLLLLGFASCHYWQIAGEFTNTNFAAADVQGWQATGFAAGLVSNCNAVSYVGGPGIVATGSISKSFTSDVPLKSVQIMFDLVLFDQWLSGWEGGRDQNTLFKLLVNNQLVHNIGSDYTRQLHAQSSNICGGAQPDRQTRVSISVPVSGSQFTVTLQANIASNNANTASWGFRNFYVLTNYGVDQSQVAVKELFDNNNFDASKWTTNYSNGISTCPDPQKLLGGFNKAGAGAFSTRTLTNLPPHSFLTVNLNAFFIDSVDANDTVVIYVDGVVAHEAQKDYLGSSSNVCGAGWNDNPQNPTTIVVPHFSSTAEIKIYVNYDQGAGDESFGFREFSVATSMPCPIIYSDVNQKGQLLSFCGNIPNLQNFGWTFPIKGIYIPDGYSLTVYADANYGGKKFSLKKSNFNLSGNEYAMINKAFNVDTVKTKLRRNN